MRAGSVTDPALIICGLTLGLLPERSEKYIQCYGRCVIIGHLHRAMGIRPRSFPLVNFLGLILSALHLPIVTT